MLYVWLVTIFHLRWICNLNLCYSLNFRQYFTRSILWSMRPWSFLNFSYVSSCNLLQTFLGNTLWEFPGFSSGCSKADIFRSWGAAADVILHSWDCLEEAKERTGTFLQDVLGRKFCYIGNRKEKIVWMSQKQPIISNLWLFLQSQKILYVKFQMFFYFM